jgi:hypothetical protein
MMTSVCCTLKLAPGESPLIRQGLDAPGRARAERKAAAKLSDLSGVDPGFVGSSSVRLESTGWRGAPLPKVAVKVGGLRRQSRSQRVLVAKPRSGSTKVSIWRRKASRDSQPCTPAKPGQGCGPRSRAKVRYGRQSRQLS